MYVFALFVSVLVSTNAYIHLQKGSFVNSKNIPSYINGSVDLGFCDYEATCCVNGWEGAYVSIDSGCCASPANHDEDDAASPANHDEDDAASPAADQNVTLQVGEKQQPACMSEFVEYRTTGSVSNIGHRVRKNDSLSGDDIGTIPYNSTVRIEKVEGDWGKLHHSMYEELQKNLYHVSHNCVIYGWVLLKDDNATYFELGKAEGDPLDPTPYIAAVLAGTAAAGAVGGIAAVTGGFAAVGLSATGPVAGGLFAANMGAGVAAGSAMATAQAWAMGTVAYNFGAVVVAGIGGVGVAYAYRWKMTG